MSNFAFNAIFSSLINANNFGEQFLYDFSHLLLSAKSIVIGDNDLVNFKKLINITSECSDMFLHSAHLLKKLNIQIQNFDLFGQIISIPIKEIFTRFSHNQVHDFSKNYSKETEYLKSINYISAKLPNIKYSVMKETFSLFCHFISNINTIYTSNNNYFTFIQSIPNILSSLFQLEINLLWHSPDNQAYIAKHLQPPHFKDLLSIIQNSSNSLVQMLIVEWMWRAKNCLSSSFDFKNPLNEFEPMFLRINEANFRSSLHDFIRCINLSKEDKNDNEIIIHIKFKAIIFNGINLNSEGYIDLNQDTVVVWFIKKGEKKIPDVIVFKFVQIYSISITENIISFLSKEKLISFEVFSNSKPMNFEFHCNDIISKSQALLFSKKCFSKTLTHRKQIIIKSKNKKAIDSSDNMLNRRVYADKPQSEIHTQNFSDSNDDEIIFSKNEYKKQIKDRIKCINNIENEKKEYRVKIMSFNDIEKSLDDFQILSAKMINDIETKVMSELNEIIEFTEMSINELNNLSKQHQDAVNNAQKTGLKLSNEADKFGKECEEFYLEVDQEGKEAFDSFVNEITHEKTEFLNGNDRIFTHNALTVLSENLQTMKTQIIDSSSNT